MSKMKYTNGIEWLRDPGLVSIEGGRGRWGCRSVHCALIVRIRICWRSCLESTVAKLFGINFVSMGKALCLTTSWRGDAPNAMGFNFKPTKP